MAEVNGTNASSFITQYEDTKKKPSNEMGKDDFLKLLVAQLTHQDPTNPMQDTEFVSQLTQYSGLEQQINMNKNIEKLAEVQSLGNVPNSIFCIGKLIGYVDDYGRGVAKTCQFVDIYDGEINLYFEDGTHIPMSRVEQIGIPSTVPADNGGSGNSNEDD